VFNFSSPRKAGGKFSPAPLLYFLGIAVAGPDEITSAKGEKIESRKSRVESRKNDTTRMFFQQAQKVNQK